MTPVTIPVVLVAVTTVALAMLLLLQSPPADPDDVSVMVDPTATAVGPLSVPAFGIAITVTTALALQPVAVSVNDILTVPMDTPVTTPVADPTLAMPVELLAQVPLPVVSDNVMAEPVHTVSGPRIGEGLAITVTTAVEIQVVPRRYVITEVPVAAPVTTPEATVAFVLLLLHVPPGVASVRFVVPNGHTV
jgi:hypothetical protein